MRDPSAFWDRIAEHYAKKPVADEAAYRHKLDVSRRYFSEDMDVLEIGCGTGSTAIAHAPHVGTIHATDFSSKMIRIARDRAEEAEVDNVEFERVGPDELPTGAERYDAVLALSLLHLLDDIDATIRGIHRLLKPGGVFISNTACIADMKLFVRLLLPIGKALGVAPRVKAFSQETLKDKITGAGFTLDHVWQSAPGKAVFIVARKDA
ncbi:MAG: class I SAM-dependent methyltransferase [Alphaproteobacteria bacterium]|nr:class I SAM-dependent methyltransferase [Alphaproteobacteria bacterium]